LCGDLWQLRRRSLSAWGWLLGWCGHPAIRLIHHHCEGPHTGGTRRLIQLRRRSSSAWGVVTRLVRAHGRAVWSPSSFSPTIESELLYTSRIKARVGGSLVYNFVTRDYFLVSAQSRNAGTCQVSSLLQRERSPRGSALVMLTLGHRCRANFSSRRTAQKQ
jgi:hypothetical protein